MPIDPKQLTVISVAANENQSGFLLLMLESVKKYTPDITNFIVVDNKNNGKVLKKITETMPYVKIVKSIGSGWKHPSTSYRHGSAINEAMKNVKTKYCAVVESDCIVLDKNWYNFDPIRYDMKACHKGIHPLDGRHYWYLCFFVFRTKLFKSMDWRPEYISGAPKKKGYNDSGWRMADLVNKTRIHNITFVKGKDKIFFKGVHFNYKTQEFRDGQKTLAAHFFRGSEWVRRPQDGGARPK